MKNLLKASTRLIAIAMVCAFVSACSQPASPGVAGFPSSVSQATMTGPFDPLTIMDY